MIQSRFYSPIFAEFSLEVVSRRYHVFVKGRKQQVVVVDFRLAHASEEVCDESRVGVASEEVGPVVDSRDALRARTDFKLKKKKNILGEFAHGTCIYCTR